MKENKDILLQNKLLSGQNIAQNNEVARLKSMIRKKEQSDSDKDTAIESLMADEAELTRKLTDIAARAEKAEKECDVERNRRQAAEKERDAALSNQLSMAREMGRLRDRLEDKTGEQKAAEDLAAKCRRENIDFQSIVRLLQLRMFNKNSDRTRFLSGEMELDEELVEKIGLAEYIRNLKNDVDRIDIVGKKEDTVKSGAAGCSVCGLAMERGNRPVKSQSGKRKPRYTYECDAKELFDIDTSEIKAKCSIIKGKDEKGEDTWYVRLLRIIPAQTVMEMHKIGHFNVQGGEPRNSKYPRRLIPGSPVTPRLHPLLS